MVLLLYLFIEVFFIGQVLLVLVDWLCLDDDVVEWLNVLCDIIQGCVDVVMLVVQVEVVVVLVNCYCYCIGDVCVVVEWLFKYVIEQLEELVVYFVCEDMFYCDGESVCDQFDYEVFGEICVFIEYVVQVQELSELQVEVQQCLGVISGYLKMFCQCEVVCECEWQVCIEQMGQCICELE